MKYWPLLLLELLSSGLPGMDSFSFPVSTAAFTVGQCGHRKLSALSPSGDVFETSFNPYYSVEDTTKIRPLHQNWWPVTTASCLDHSKPNLVQALGQNFVVIRDESEWRCVPGPRGVRVGPEILNRLGMEATGHMSAGTILSSALANYPVRLAAGMVWIWTDHETVALSEKTTLPVSPLLYQWHRQFGDNSCFFRDVPFCMSDLAEQFLDVSRLPFVYHGLAGFHRSQARPLSIEVLQRKQGPLLQGVIDPETDPVFAAMQLPIPANSTASINFYPPNHIRFEHERGTASSTEIFLCPLSEGKTRVFVTQTFEAALLYEDEPKLRAAVGAVMAKIIDPGSIRHHHFLHELLDRDLVLLKKNGLQSVGPMPQPVSSSDEMGYLFRIYWKEVLQATQKIGREDIVSVLTLSTSPSRLQVLDRTSHTKHCRACQAALRQQKDKYETLTSLRRALIGATGASIFFTTLLKFLAVGQYAAFPPVVVRAIWTSAVSAAIITSSVQKRRNQIGQIIKQFVANEDEDGLG